MAFLPSHLPVHAFDREQVSSKSKQHPWVDCPHRSVRMKRGIVLQATQATRRTMLDGLIDSLIGLGTRNVSRINPHCLEGMRKGGPKRPQILVHVSIQVGVE